MIRTLTALLLLACAAQAADDDVRFKPKPYTGKKLQDRTYQAPAYAPAETPKPIGTPLKPSRGGFWSLFKSSRNETAQRLSGAASAKDTPYRQEQQISVPTISADPSAIPDKKPFDDNGKKLSDADYKAPEKSNEKNPLLKPRQSIKETE